jgi:Domain of unknown function (DUF4397)
MKFQSFLSVFAATALLGLTSCEKEKTVEETPVENANVMVIHASPTAPAVDVLVDDKKVAGPAVFGINTNYLTVKAGTRNVKVNVAGTSTSAINAPVTVAKDKNYSIFAVTDAATITPLVFTDDLTAPAAGKAHVRVIHLSPDAPAVDVAITGGAVLFPALAFKTATAFTPVNAGTYNLEIRAAGATTAVLPIPGVVFTAGKIYTVYAKGYLTPPAGNTNPLSVSVIVNK